VSQNRELDTSVSKMSSSLLLQRLYEIHGEEWIPIDETPDSLKRSDRIRLLKNGGAFSVLQEEDVKHTDLTFHQFPQNTLTSATLMPRLKKFHPDIDSPSPAGARGVFLS
jgi:hypothetical protein